MKKIICLLWLGVVGIMELNAWHCAMASSESAKDFYQKNMVSLVVTYGPGGGTDASARIMAANWKTVTGGTMMVKNVTGAGGIVGMNQVYSSKPDGLTLGYTDSASSLLGPVFFKNPGIRFDATKFVYLAANAIQPNGLGIAKGLAAESIEDLQKMTGLKFGSHGIDAQAAGSAMMIELFGLKDARIVGGYSGMEEEGLALARGEVDAYSNSMGSMDDHVKKGFVKKVVLVYGYKRNPWFPDAPLPMELVKFTREQDMLYRILFACRAAKPIFAPPGLPKDKTDFLRRAFERLFGLQTYLNQMKVRYPIIDPEFHMTGKGWAKMTEEVLAYPETEREKFIAIVNKYLK
jgi:tripartite-type tricarboxylate transporter receptor subunit TctC